MKLDADIRVKQQQLKEITSEYDELAKKKAELNTEWVTFYSAVNQPARFFWSAIVAKVC